MYRIYPLISDVVFDTTGERVLIGYEMYWEDDKNEQAFRELKVIFPEWYSTQDKHELLNDAKIRADYYNER